jgi:hypothetical protein
MKIHSLYGPLLLLFFISACGEKRDTIDFGKTTKADLIALKGQPKEEKEIPVKDSEVLVFDDEKFQLKGDVVTHGFRLPKGEETTVLFWRHKFKDCNVKETVLPKGNGHLVPDIQLSCPSEGISIIYPEGSDLISRIIEHEKQ